MNEDAASDVLLSAGAMVSGEKRSDTLRFLTPIEALQRDFVQVLTHPVVVGNFWIDLEKALCWLDGGERSSSERLTLTHLIIKAAAHAILDAPMLHRMYGPWRVVEPGHADIGVSVEGRQILSPVVVIKEADRKSLGDIARELREKAIQVREAEPRDIAKINRFLWLFPFPALRRFFTRLVLRSPRFRRQISGTLQFSNIGHFGIDAASVPLVVETLLVGGVVRKRLFLDEEGQLRSSRGADFRLHASHRKLNGRTCGQFLSSFQRLLGNPEQMSEG